MRAGLTALLRRRFSSTALLSTAVIVSNPWMGKTGIVKKVEQKKPFAKGTPLNLELVPVEELLRG